MSPTSYQAAPPRVMKAGTLAITAGIVKRASVKIRSRNCLSPPMPPAMITALHLAEFVSVIFYQQTTGGTADAYTQRHSRRRHHPDHHARPDAGGRCVRPQ